MTKKSALTSLLSSLLVLFMLLPMVATGTDTTVKAAGETFIIDPGHGGNDPGALGSDPYREEADDTLRLSLAVGEIVSQYTSVTYTRTTDKTMELAERSSLANAGGHKYLISIHRNSFSDPTAKGLSIFYYNGLSSNSPSALFATDVYNEVIAAAPFWSRGVKSENFHMVREPNMPSCLIETGFISNNNDNAIFDQYFNEIAFAIAKGMLKQIGITPTQGLSNKLEGVSPLYLGENFDAWIRQSATNNYLTDVGGNIYSQAEKFDDSQRWHFIYNKDDGSYFILNDAKNQYLDVPYAKYEDNNGIWLCNYNGGEAQRFYIYFIKGHFFFRTVGSDKVFDVNSFSNNRLELCGNNTGTTDISFNARAFEILKFNNDYSHWCYNLGKTNSTFIRNPATGLMMTAEGNSVVFKEATYGDDQRWIMGRRGDGSYEFKSVSTGLYLDVLYGEMAAGTTVDLFTYNGLRPQGFYVLPNEQWSGHYYIKPCYSNTVLNMDSSAKDLTLQELNKADSSAVNAQTFEIVLDGIDHNKYPPTYLGDSFYGYLTGKESGNTLTDTGNGSLLAQPTTYADNQLFKFEYDANTLTYKITGSSGKCIDVTYTHYNDGSTIGMHEDNGWAAQRFRFYEIDGYLYISPFYTNRLVDISLADSATVQLYGTTPADFRAFTLKKSEPVSRKLIVKNESDLIIDNGFLFKLAPQMTVDFVISQFENKGVEIRNISGEKITGSQTVKTGFTANLVSDGEIIDSVPMIILGDLTSDGVVDSTDYLRIKSAFLSKLTLDEISTIAADVDGSGKIDATDYLRVKGHFLGSYDLHSGNQSGLTIEDMEIVEGTPADPNPIFEEKTYRVEYSSSSEYLTYDSSTNQFLASKEGITATVTAKTAFHKVTFKVKSVKSPKSVTVSDVNAFIGYPESDFYPNVSNAGFSGKFTYSYDTSALTINENTNTVKALKAGTYKVTGSYKNFTFSFNVICHNVDKSDKKYNVSTFVSTATKNSQIWESQAENGKTTLFIGDSYFDDPFWTSFYNDDYFGLYNALRLGICATTTSHWEYYLTEGWLKNTTIQPKNIVIDIGTNNVLDHEEGPDAEKLIIALQRLYTVMHAKFPDAKIYWLEITQRYPTYDRILVWNEVAKTVNTEMKKWCAERDYITFVDVWNNEVPSIDYYGIAANGYTDETHLNDKGYRVLVDSIMKTDIEILSKDISFSTADTIGGESKGVKTVYYAGAPLTENYVITGDITIGATATNPHLQFYFQGGSMLERFLVWDYDSDGSFHIRYQDQESGHVLNKSNGTLNFSFKLVVKDDNAYFFTKQGSGEYKLTLVFTKIGAKNLVIGSENATTTFENITIATEKHDSDKYLDFISDKTVSKAISSYGNATDTSRITA